MAQLLLLGVFIALKATYFSFMFVHHVLTATAILTFKILKGAKTLLLSKSHEKILINAALDRWGLSPSKICMIQIIIVSEN